MSIVVDLIKGAVDFVVDAVEAVGEVVVSVVKPIANFVGSAVEAVVNLADDILDVAGTLIENYAVQAAFVAMGVPPVYAAPLTASTTTLARGGSFSDAIKAGAVSIATTKVSNTVFSQARAAGFSVTQATAAASAASSATATAAYGGDLKDILKSGAIGGISSAAGSQVMEATDNKYLANFVRTATSAALRGQKLDQAILMGASASTIQYLDEYIELANAQDELIERWKDEAAAYSNAVTNYNDAVETLQGIQRSIEIYQEMGNQIVVDQLVRQFNDLYATLPDLEAAYRDAEANFLPFDRQLRNLQRPMDELLQKAAEELGEQITDWEVPIEQELQSEEQRIIQQIQQVAERPALSPLDETLLAGPVPVAASVPQQIIDRGERIVGQEDRVDPDTKERYVNYKVEGYTRGDINSIDPRGLYDPSLFYTYEVQVFPESNDVQYFWSFQKDAPEGSGLLPEITLVSSKSPPNISEDGKLISSKAAPVETAAPIGKYTPQFSSNLTQLQVENQIIQSQLQNIDKSIADVGNEVKALESQKTQLDKALADAQKIQSQATNQQTANEAQRVIDQIQTQKTQIDQAIVNTQAQVDALNAQKQPLAGRIEENAATEQQLLDAEREQMFIQALDKAIAQLEQDVAKAKSDEEATQAQTKFVQEQRERLKEQGRLRPTTEQTLESELSRLLDEYESAQERGTGASERLSELRPEGGGVGGPITDEEVIRYLGLSGEEASRYGLGGPGTGVSGTGGPGTIGGAGGEGVVGGGTPEDAEATEAEPAPITEIPQPPESGIGAFTPIVPQQDQRTQGISGRVTGQSLVGILGDKEPTFGGDPGQQQEVWNIRSLRLRRALGL